nr:hydrolase [Leisingera aquaemixtae]
MPGEEMKEITGDFITRVFEGPYRRARDWMHDMEVAAEADGKTAGRIFMFYTTCPKCARAYGKNYVIGVAEVL